MPHQEAQTRAKCSICGSPFTTRATIIRPDGTTYNFWYWCPGCDQVPPERNKKHP